MFPYLQSFKIEFLCATNRFKKLGKIEALIQSAIYSISSACIYISIYFLSSYIIFHLLLENRFKEYQLKSWFFQGYCILINLYLYTIDTEVYTTFVKQFSSNIYIQYYCKEGTGLTLKFIITFCSGFWEKESNSWLDFFFEAKILWITTPKSTLATGFPKWYKIK